MPGERKEDGLTSGRAIQSVRGAKSNLAFQTLPGSGISGRPPGAHWVTRYEPVKTAGPWPREGSVVSRIGSAADEGAGAAAGLRDARDTQRPL